MERLKGLILSGGAGTRLRPITHTSAKQLVPVANKPVLFYGIEALVEAGVDEIGIIVSPQTGDEIRAATGDGSRFGASIEHITQEEPLGLAHAVLTAEEYLQDGPFVMYLGDNLLRDGITELVEHFRESEPDALTRLLRDHRSNLVGQIPRVARKELQAELLHLGRVAFDLHVALEHDAAQLVVLDAVLDAVEEHGLVRHWHELLGGGMRNRAQPGAGPAGEDQALEGLHQYAPPSLLWSQVTTRVGTNLSPTRFGACWRTISRVSG